MNSVSVFVVLLLFYGSVAAQSDVVIAGRVLQEGTNAPLQGVHVKNESYASYAVTDDEGKFLIKAKEGHILKFTYVGKQNLLRTLVAADFQDSAVLEVKMKEEITHLEEVEVSKQKITSESIGLYWSKPLERTYEEKREYANTRILPHGIWPLLLGNLPINLNALIYTISGKRKMYKQLVKNEKNLKVATHIRENYSDFLRKDLRLTDMDIEALAYFVMEKPDFHAAIAKKDEKQIEFLLVDAWVELQKRTQEYLENNPESNSQKK